MKTAILIHGCHLQAKGWEDIFWGDPKNGIFGRGSKGIQLAVRKQAGLIYWGTGASECDGVVESQYSFNHAITHAPEVMDFSGLDVYEAESILRPISYIDTVSQTTPQEVEKAMVLCRSEGMNQLILVSSPTHIARCLQSAEKVRAGGNFSGLEVVATASDTCFADSTPADVLIVEPPHRGDRAEIPLHKTLKLAMFARKLDEGKAEEFNKRLTAFLEEQKRLFC